MGRITLGSVDEETCRNVLCYPRFEEDEFRARLRELKELGVEDLEFGGSKKVGSVPVLGKGHVGVVLIALRGLDKVALKIRRTDADRSTMNHEAEMLEKANKVDVGPCLLGVTDNFLMMEYVDGLLIPEWLRSVEEGGFVKEVHYVIRSLLSQAWRLDQTGLDHGELSQAPKHIIIRLMDEPCLVDFESASISRRVSNVTSLCQYLLLGRQVAPLVQAKLGLIRRESLLSVLRAYKGHRSEENFLQILRTCRL